MIPDDWLTRRSSERTIYGVAALWIALLKQYLFSSLLLYPQWLNGPTYEGQAKCFSPQNLSRFLNKSAVNQLQTTLARRLQRKKPVCINYQSGKQEWM